MGYKWFKTKFPGVRYREHPTRKNGSVQPDRYFTIRVKRGKFVSEEAIGWATEGVTAEKAHRILAHILNNIRAGAGPTSYAELREENERRQEDAKLSEQDFQKRNVTFSQFWESVYFPYANAAKKPSTMDSEKWLYSKWIAPFIGNINLPDLSVSDIEQIINSAAKANKSAATIRYILAVISQVWSKAELNGLVSDPCPTKKIKKPRKDNRRMRFLTREEATRLLVALKVKSIDVHDIALLSLYTGMRAGEINALTWADIDFQNNQIAIRDPKNKNNRFAFMVAEVREMLLGRQRDNSKMDLLFPASNGSIRKGVTDTFARVVASLGLNDSGEFTIDKEGNRVPVQIADARHRVVFHTLRHTFASWLVQNGIPLYTVAELMGHTTLEMTRRYSHLAPDSLRKATMSLQGAVSLNSN